MVIQTFPLPGLCEVSIFKATICFSRKNRANDLFLLNKLQWQPLQLAFSGLKIFHTIFIVEGRKKGRKKTPEIPVLQKQLPKYILLHQKFTWHFPQSVKPDLFGSWVSDKLHFYENKAHAFFEKLGKTKCSQFTKGCSYDQLHYCLTSWQIISHQGIYFSRCYTYSPSLFKFPLVTRISNICRRITQQHSLNYIK